MTDHAANFCSPSVYRRLKLVASFVPQDSRIRRHHLTRTGFVPICLAKEEGRIKSALAMDAWTGPGTGELT